jgi:hypothetical protein
MAGHSASGHKEMRELVGPVTSITLHRERGWQKTLQHVTECQYRGMLYVEGQLEITQCKFYDGKPGRHWTDTQVSHMGRNGSNQHAYGSLFLAQLYLDSLSKHNRHNAHQWAGGVRQDGEQNIPEIRTTESRFMGKAD